MLGAFSFLGLGTQETLRDEVLPTIRSSFLHRNENEMYFSKVPCGLYSPSERASSLFLPHQPSEEESSFFGLFVLVKFPG